ncbi:MAG: hypothetical protein KatS3mg111_0263 [Pirellulaceae bacterium]|nr:MAG: hypothetical protein KatS3mg111_0263 [Pirellulaceae bacterium]
MRVRNLTRTKGTDATLVVGLEGVGPWMVGACGAHGARTPHLDRLAASSDICLHSFVDSVALEQQLLGMWTGRHACAGGLPEQTLRSTPHEPSSPTDPGNPRSRTETDRGSSGPALDTLWHQMAAEEKSGTLVTDVPEVAEAAERAGCSMAILVQTASPPTQAAEEAAQCVCMELFRVAAEMIADGYGGLLWVHSKGLYHPWDAPLALRHAMIDPDDPPPPAGIHPPGELPDYRPRWLAGNAASSQFDPDLVLGWNQVAAAQTAVLDQGIGLLRAALEARGEEHSWNWLIHSLGQIPLGEHGALGSPLTVPYLEHLRMLAIVRPAAQQLARFRQAILQSPDFYSVLAAWMLAAHRNRPPHSTPAAHGAAAEWPACWGNYPLADDSPTHWLAVTLDAKQGGPGWIRSPAWSVRRDSRQVQLFVQPDDRWEVGDVADLEADIASSLIRAGDAFIDAAKNHRRLEAGDEMSALINQMR